MRAPGNTAERLGWPEGARVAVFHMDDAGMCRSCNLGVIAALEQGRARSLSMMVPGASFRELAEYLQVHPEVDAGVHLTFTSEFREHRWYPLSDRARVPSLVDPAGAFWPDGRAMMAHARADEVVIEARAQIEAAQRAGIQVSHLDAHMGVLLTRRDLFDCYAALGAELRLPVLAATPTRAARLGIHAKKIRHRVLRRKCYEFPVPDAAALDQAWHAGLPLVDRIYADMLGWPPSGKGDRLLRLLRSLRPGITVILFHCAAPSPDDALLEETRESRHADLRALLDPRVPAVLRDEGIITSTLGELMRRRADPNCAR